MTSQFLYGFYFSFFLLYKPKQALELYNSLEHKDAKLIVQTPYLNFIYPRTATFIKHPQ